MTGGVSRLEAQAAPMFQPNIDTDIIIPSREMKAVSKTGLGVGLFANRRYRNVDARDPDPGFVLNQAPFDQARILVTGPNFGCGSSREHAVWALRDYGIRAVVAPSFGAIFYNNCIRNGVVPAIVDAAIAERWAEALAQDPAEGIIRVDVSGGEVTGPDGHSVPLTLGEEARQMLENGWDPIDLTLQHSAAIDAFWADDRGRRPWAHAPLQKVRRDP